MQALTLGLMASMVSFLAHGLVDTGFRLTDLAFVFMLTLGIVRNLGTTTGESSQLQRFRNQESLV